MKFPVILTLLVATLLGEITPTLASFYQPAKEILIVQKNRTDADFQQGKKKYDQRKFKEAIAKFDAAIRLKPDFALAYVYRGLAYKKLGKLEEAIDDYTQALNLSSNNPQFQSSIYYNRGLAYSDSRKLKEAIDDFTLAIQLNAKDASAYYQRGFILAERSDIKGAIADFSKAIALNPSYLSAYAQRGLIFNGYLGDLPSAIANFVKAVRLKPQDADDYWNRGSARSALGNIKGAAADFTEALRLNPHSSRAYSSRAGVRNFLGDKKGANADLAQAMKIMLTKSRPDAGTLNALVTINFSDLKSEPELLQQVSNLADAAVVSLPEDSIMYIFRGNIRLIQANEQGALADFTQAIHFTPESAMAYYLRANIGSQQSNTQNTLVDLTQAISLSPNFAEAYLARGILLQQLGDPQAQADFNQAIRIYTEAIRLNPNGAGAYFSRGKAYMQLGKTEDATTDWLQVGRLLRKEGIKSTMSQCQQRSITTFRYLLCQ